MHLARRTGMLQHVMLIQELRVSVVNTKNPQQTSIEVECLSHLRLVVCRPRLPTLGTVNESTAATCVA